MMNYVNKKHDINLNVLKMILDSLMIGQLLERQEVEDRKQIGLFGLRKTGQFLNTHEPRSNGEGAKEEASTEEDTENVQQIPTVTNSGEYDPKILKVDRNCLTCSGNPSQVIQQLKLACLSFTSSPINYQDKKYEVSEMLRVKANVLAECQRVIRDNLFC